MNFNFSVCPSPDAPHTAASAPSTTAAAPQQVQRYFELLYPDPPDAAWLVVSFFDTNRRWCSQWFPVVQRADAAACAGLMADWYNVYFGIGLRHPDCTPAVTKRGDSTEVYAVPGLWVEMDHSAGVHAATDLPTSEELLAFIDTLPFRFSLMIDSTGGYHGYVLFKEPWLLNTPEEHQAAALLLRRFQRTIQAQAAAQGWRVDSTADLARVLRPAGTLNHKSGSPKLVTILYEEAVRYNPSDIADAPWLAAVEDPYTPATIPGNCPPTRLEPIVDGCAWLRHCRDDAATLQEPEWYGMLGIVGRCADGEQIAHAWSTPYLRYNRDETTHKLQRALADAGPRTCSTIRYDLGGEEACRACQHWGKVKSPIVLGIPPSAHLLISHGSLNGTAIPPTQDIDPLPYSDLYNARALVSEHGENMRYCHPWKKWLVWTGNSWQEDRTGAIMRLAKAVMKRMARHVETLAGTEARALLAHVKTSLATTKLKAMVESAQSELGIPVLPEALDQDPWLLNCSNGTLDLKTGTLRAHDRADLLTRSIPVAYDEAALCPTWDAFLQRIMNGNPHLIDFLQRAIGYALTGVIWEHVLLILWGTGRNGKSTFLNTLRALLGPYAIKAPSELLMVNNNDRHPTERADLFGKRFVAAIETEQGRRLAEVFVKEATGGDPIRARRMREDFWEFQPTHKVFLATNHKPVIKGTDHAIWERLRLVPFNITIPKDERDTALPDKLQAELPGILAWAVRGCLAWQQEGLGEPEEVQQATAGYRTEMDVLGQFIAECCLVGPHYRTKAADLYGAYKRWCEQQGVPYDVQRTWGVALTERGYERKRGTAGSHWWLGIGLHTPIPPGREDDVEDECDPRVTQVTESDPTNGLNNIQISYERRTGALSHLGHLGHLGLTTPTAAQTCPHCGCPDLRDGVTSRTCPRCFWQDGPTVQEILEKP
jgi:phage/plasmid primase, P4 family, C-terminal domain